MLRIAIVGVGAMGCLFAAALTPIAQVAVLGHWPAQIAALGRGLTLIAPGTGHKRVALQLFTAAHSMPPCDVALVLVKSHQSAAAGGEIARFLSTEGVAVTLQNGLGNHRQLAASLGKERVVLGSTTEGATLEGLGTVRHAGRGLTILQRGDERQQAHVRNLAALLGQAGFQTEVSNHVGEVVWRKLAVNAAINPLTALLEQPNGALLQDESRITIMRRIAEEVARVARAVGFDVGTEEAATQAIAVARATSANLSSMLQDVLAGRPTELEAISGAVLQHGRNTGIAMPYTSGVYQLLQAKLAGQDWQSQLVELPAEAQALLDRLRSTGVDG